MFDNFTFAAQAQTNLDEVPASPTDISFPSPLAPPPTSFFPAELDSVSDIVNQFSKQSLYPESENELPQQSIWQSREDGECPKLDLDHDMESFSPEELTYVSTTRGMVTINAWESRPLPNTPTLPTPKSGTVACRRLQRQLNVQLQSCSNHVRDINSLVEDMIVSNSQCRLHTSPSRLQLSNPPPTRPSGLIVDTTEEPPPFEDEGFAEIDESTWGIEEEMSLRRASTPSGIRKYNHARWWRSSAECVNSPVMGTGGVMKVRNVTRMRRRMPKSVPE